MLSGQVMCGRWVSAAKGRVMTGTQSTKTSESGVTHFQRTKKVFSLLSEIRTLWTVRILARPQSPDDLYNNQRLYLGRGVCDYGGNPDVGNLDDGWDGT